MSVDKLSQNLLKCFVCLAAALVFGGVVAHTQRAKNAQQNQPPANTTVRGRVFYADTGRAVRRAVVMLLPAEKGGGGGGREFSGITNSSGEFEIKRVRAGSYFPLVNAPGIVTPVAYLTERANGGSEADMFAEIGRVFPPIVVNGINDADVSVPATRGGAIGGRITYADGDPAIGVSVEVMRKREGKFTTVLANFSALGSMMFGGGDIGGSKTDDRGVYRFSGLPPGEYVVKVTEPAEHKTGDASGSGGDSFAAAMFGGQTASLLTTFYPDAANAKEAKTLNVELGQEQGEVNITIPERRLFNVAGTVLNKMGKTPVKNAQITLKKTDDQTSSPFEEIERRRQTVVTEALGRWQFKEIPKGNYTVVVEPRETYEDGDIAVGMTNMSTNMSMNTAVVVNSASAGATRASLPPKPKLAKKFQEITIDNQDLTNVVVELSTGGNISGTIAVEGGKSMPDFVSVSAQNEREENLASDTVGNYQGTENGAANVQKPENQKHDFKLDGVPEGKTFIRFAVNDDNFYVKSARAGDTDLLASPVDLKESESLKNVQVILASDAGTLLGKVSGAQDQPQAARRILIVSTDANKRRARNLHVYSATDEKGEFTRKLAPGEYFVILFEPQTGGGDAFYKWLDEAVKDAAKVTIEANKTQKVSLKSKT
jgi:5-hydroxyisourate hydrolase-like protein (transthyretin family)